MQQNIAPFILTQQQKQLLMKVILMMYLNQSIGRLYQTSKDMLEKVQARLLTQLQITALVFQSTSPQLVAVIQITKRIKPSKIGLVNIQNISDNKCLKWCLIRYLHPADHHSSRIRKVDKNFARYLDFKDIKFPVKIRDIHKFEKNN